MSKIFSRQRGKGNPVVLLHGFPMDHTIWDELAEALSEECNVFTPDLPGFGKSEMLPLPFSLDTVAVTLLQWLEENELNNVVLIGHSLGGYVALAMVEKKPDVFSGLGLFHSTAYADNAEKKESRTKVIKFIDENGVEAFTSNFVQPLFADSKHPDIESIKTLSVQSSAEAVKGFTIAMRDRPDRTSVLKSFTKPVLFIGGQHDSVIPLDSVNRQANLCKHSVVKVLKNSGHMGMIEEKQESLVIVKSYLQQIYAFRA